MKRRTEPCEDWVESFEEGRRANADLDVENRLAVWFLEVEDEMRLERLRQGERMEGDEGRGCRAR